MELAFHSGLVIPEATEDNIRQHLPEEVYTILRVDRDHFIQCRVKFPWPAYGSSEFKILRRRRGRIRKFPKLPYTSRAWPNQGYLLEYQNGTLAQRYQATNHVTATHRLVTLAQVTECLCKYSSR